MGLILGTFRSLLALGLAMLPRRYWPRFESEIPIASATFAAGLITLFAGAALGISGFFAYVSDVTAQNNSAYMAAALEWRTDTLPPPSYLGTLTIFTFVLLTPEGWASSYLALSGLVRAIGSQLDDPHGDFILTAVDSGVRRVATATARRAEVDNRRLLEGPLVRDRLAGGPHFGFADTNIVIVTSRIKGGWQPGVVVLSERGEFRIVHMEDRTIGGHLRHIYVLAPHADLEAFRKTVRYEFPRQSPVQ